MLFGTKLLTGCIRLSLLFVLSKNMAFNKSVLEKFSMSIFTCSSVTVVVGTNFGPKDKTVVSSASSGFDDKLYIFTFFSSADWFDVSVCRAGLVG